MIYRILFILLVAYTEVSSLQCSRYKFGETVFTQCPHEFFDEPHEIYCCGTKRFRRCCSSPDGDDDDIVPGISVGSIFLIVFFLGGIIAAIFACRYICNWRNRGTAYNSTYVPAIAQPVQTISSHPVPQPSPVPSYPAYGLQPSTGSTPYPTQPYPAQPTQPYPTQPTQPYPTQPSQPYPTQPSQPYPTQPSQPYPPQPTQPYSTKPTQPADDPPPPYSDIQPAYNPNY